MIMVNLNCSVACFALNVFIQSTHDKENKLAVTNVIH